MTGIKAFVKGVGFTAGAVTVIGAVLWWLRTKPDAAYIAPVWNTPGAPEEAERK